MSRAVGESKHGTPGVPDDMRRIPTTRADEIVKIGHVTRDGQCLVSTAALHWLEDAMALAEVLRNRFQVAGSTGAAMDSHQCVASGSVLTGIVHL